MLKNSRALYQAAKADKKRRFFSLHDKVCRIEFSYGYRPGRSARQASTQVCKWLNFGLTNVVDVDIKGFFGHVNHGKLLSFVGERVADGYVLGLVKGWL